MLIMSYQLAEQLNELIDFTCTKCRRTAKNPNYFIDKTDLQCPDCQATMKFQCPHCKLLFRQFDNARRHSRLCQIDDERPAQVKFNHSYKTQCVRKVRGHEFSYYLLVRINLKNSLLIRN